MMLRSTRVRLMALLLLSGGCGAAQGPPPPDNITNPPPSTPGGTIQGKYVFRLEPAAECRAPRTSFSFRVDATPDNGRRSGVRIVLENVLLVNSEDPILEMELMYTTPTLTGSIATMPWIESGVRSQEGTYVWIQGVATASVATGTAGVGEVAQGTMVADLSFGRQFADRDGQGSCVAALSRWSLLVQ
jgi:hypothetical protein